MRERRRRLVAERRVLRRKWEMNSMVIVVHEVVYVFLLASVFYTWSFDPTLRPSVRSSRDETACAATLRPRDTDLAQTHILHL